MKKSVMTGADVLCDDISPLDGYRHIGLVTNQTGVASNLECLPRVLQSVLGNRLTSLLGPEHGIYGHIQDRERIGDQRDGQTGLPVYSLYGEEESPTSDVLKTLDAVVFDIQDVGVRFYTFLSTLFNTLKAAQANNVPLFVLDRPNPITGFRVEGPLMEKDLRSFEGVCGIPIRHGMTLGELALYLNESEAIGAEIVVVPLREWKRNMWFEETKVPWVPPSPNMPTVDTATVYPGLCLIEGTNISEGRGTTRPFELVGAPWIDGDRLADDLNGENLDGVRFRPARFQPTFWKYEGETCFGVQVHVTDRNRFQPLFVALTLIQAVVDLWPDDFEWTRVSGDNRFFFDRLVGTASVRLCIDNRTAAAEIVAGFEADECHFLNERKPFLLYHS